MFQFMSNQNISIEMKSIVPSSGRLGGFYTENEYAWNKALFVSASCIIGISYLLLFLGLLSR
jgi:hypothetical protein